MSRKPKAKTLEQFMSSYLTYDALRIEQHIVDGEYRRVSREEFSKNLSDELYKEIVSHRIVDVPSPAVEAPKEKA